jgi:TldD protein
MEIKNAVFARSGTFDCFLDSQLAGILSHEAIGHTRKRTLCCMVPSRGLSEQTCCQRDRYPDVIANTWDGVLCPVPVFIDDEGTEARMQSSSKTAS